MMNFIEHNKGAKVEVFVLAYNEAFMLPHFMRHVYKHFRATVTVFDNCSTDDTVKIAKNLGATVRSYNTNNEIRDDEYLRIKNSAWKNSKADFVLVCDMDEFLEVNFNCEKYSIINTKGYDVLGPQIDSRFGAPNPLFNKVAFFRPNCFKEINYAPGCHSCDPVPISENSISGSKEFATLLHRKYISPEYVYAKHEEYENRLSEFNRKYEYGKEYIGATLESVEKKFEEIKANANLIL